MITEMDDRLQIFDFLYLRADTNIKFDETFDEGFEFLNQMENKLNYLINEVENARREGNK
jgi:glutathione synthase/RimK-type ligase-like ATP-grasp enzyme